MDITVHALTILSSICGVSITMVEIQANEVQTCTHYRNEVIYYSDQLLSHKSSWAITKCNQLLLHTFPHNLYNHYTITANQVSWPGVFSVSFVALHTLFIPLLTAFQNFYWPSSLVFLWRHQQWHWKLARCASWRGGCCCNVRPLLADWDPRNSSLQSCIACYSLFHQQNNWLHV